MLRGFTALDMPLIVAQRLRRGAKNFEKNSCNGVDSIRKFCRLVEIVFLVAVGYSSQVRSRSHGLHEARDGKEPERKGHRPRNPHATMKETEKKALRQTKCPRAFPIGAILGRWPNTPSSTPSPESMRNFPPSNAGPTNFRVMMSRSPCPSSRPFARRRGSPILG